MLQTDTGTFDRAIRPQLSVLFNPRVHMALIDLQPLPPTDNGPRDSTWYQAPDITRADAYGRGEGKRVFGMGTRTVPSTRYTYARQRPID